MDGVQEDLGLPGIGNAEESANDEKVWRRWIITNLTTTTENIIKYEK